jgi:hypothetical protein
MLVNIISIWSILVPFHIFYFHLVYFVVIFGIFSPFGMLNLDKSGNPARQLFDILILVQAFERTQNGYFLKWKLCSFQHQCLATFTYNKYLAVVIQDIQPKWQSFFDICIRSCFWFQNALGYPWCCKFLQRWRCNSRSLDCFQHSTSFFEWIWDWNEKV